MAGLDPAIHLSRGTMDARLRAGHGENENVFFEIRLKLVPVLCGAVHLLLDVLRREPDRQHDNFALIPVFKVTSYHDISTRLRQLPRRL